MDSLAGVDLSLGERATLLAHYKFADQDGRNCRASTETIAAYLNTSVDTVKKYRRSLRASGWLVEVERGHNTGAGGNTTSHHEVAIPLGLVIDAPRPKRAPRNPKGANQYSRGVKDSTPNETDRGGNQTSNRRNGEVTLYHLPSSPSRHGSEEPLPNGDEEQQHSSIALETGQPGGESGSAFADREVGASGDELLTSGPDVAGDAKGTPAISNAKEKQDPWGAAPSHTRNDNYPPRDDLPPGAA